MMRCIRTEFHKCIYVPFFLLNIFGSFALCLSAIAEYDYNGKSLTIFELIRTGTAGSSIDTSNLMLWKQGGSGWLSLLLPVLSTAGYLLILSSERNSGEMGSMLIRMGNFRFVTAKITGGALAGGIGFTCGYALFGLLIYLTTPAFSGFSSEEQMILLTGSGTSHIAAFILFRLIGCMAYGMAVSVFGIGVSIVFRDKYMLVCLPFLLNYIYSQMLQMLSSYGVLTSSDGTSWLPVFSLDSLLNMTPTLSWIFSVLFILAVYILLGGLFYLEIKRKGCNG